MKRKVFIGSSTEGLQQAHQIANLLSNNTTECVLWNTLFEPGYLAFETLENMLLDCAAAVLIATPDDKSTIRDRVVSTPRANIMLEFGLLAGRLGRHNIAICRYGATELPSDLKGLTVIEMDAAPPVAILSPTPSQRSHAEETLLNWSSRLLPTVDQVPRSDIVHGYTGSWDFDLKLDHWRGVTVLAPSYAQGSGRILLNVDDSGTTGYGFVAGRLTFKLMTGTLAAPRAYAGDLRFCHEITNLTCDIEGGMKFTSRTFALHRITTSGDPLPELGALDDPVEPWPFSWLFTADDEPRALDGTIDANNPGPTHGSVRITRTVGYV